MTLSELASLPQGEIAAQGSSTNTTEAELMTVFKSLELHRFARALGSSVFGAGWSMASSDHAHVKLQTQGLVFFYLSTK